MSPPVFSRFRRPARHTGAKRQKRISAILRSFTNRERNEATFGDLSKAFDARAFGAFFILFGGINLVPLPPGASFVAGVPLLLVTIQLALGRTRLWLPRQVREMRVSPETLAKIMARLGPPLRRVERLAHPRLWPFPDRIIGPAIGWISFLMATFVAIPAPFTNMFPGVAIALFGVALTARDGAWLIAGLVVALGSTLFLIGVYGAAMLAIMHFM